MLVVVERGVRSEQFIDAVDRAPAVLARRHVRDDLGDLRRCRLDGLGRLDLRVADAESTGQHVLEVDKAAVRHWGIRVVVKVVEVNVTLLMRVCHVRRQHLEADRLAHHSSGEVTLSIEDLGVLIRVLVHDRLILVEKLRDGMVEVRRLTPREITLNAVVDIRAGHVVLALLEQHVLHGGLDLVDLDSRAIARVDLANDVLNKALDGALVGGFERAMNGLESLGEGLTNPDVVKAQRAPVSLHDLQLGARVLGPCRRAW